MYTAIAQKENIKSSHLFNASVVWLHKFKCRSDTKHAVYHGKDSSGDLVTADSLPEIATKIVQEGGYALDKL